MNDENGGEVAAEGVITDSSPESTAKPAEDVLKNVKAEMSRKIGKLSDENKHIRAQLDRLVGYVEQTQVRAPAVEADDHDAPDYKRYVDARFQEAHKDQVKKAQETAWQQAVELFPELNQESETFDEKFYKMADKHYGSFDLTRDPEAPLKAARLAALEMGKIEQLAKEKLLKDEARRSRIIAEGSSSPKENKREREPKLNEGNLARLGITGKRLERLKSEMKKGGAE